MIRFVNLARGAFYLALCAFVVYAGFLLHAASAHLRYSEERFDDLSREAALATANVRHATATWEAASKAQSDAATLAATNTNAALVKLGGLIDHLSETADHIDQNSLRAFNAIEHDVDDETADLQILTRSTDASIKTTAQDASASLQSLSDLSKQATIDLADPNIAKATANMTDASGHLDNATASFDRDSLMIETAVKRATKPATFIVKLGSTLLDVAAKLGSIAAGFIK